MHLDTYESSRNATAAFVHAFLVLDRPDPTCNYFHVSFISLQDLALVELVSPNAGTNLGPYTS